MNDPGGLAEKRAKWHSYFEQRITGSAAEVNAATEGAMRAIAKQADVNGVIAAGLAAARHFRTHGELPPEPRNEPPKRSSAPPPSAASTSTSQDSSTSRRTSRPQATTQATAIGSASSGLVNGMQQRQEMVGRTYFTVWNFRLERRDASGNTLTPIPVEMRGRYFKGGINNGDLVDVGRTARPGKLVKVQRVRNLTVGTEVKAVGRPHRVVRGIFLFLFMILFLVVAGIVITGIATTFPQR